MLKIHFEPAVHLPCLLWTGHSILMCDLLSTCNIAYLSMPHIDTDILVELKLKFASIRVERLFFRLIEASMRTVNENGSIRWLWDNLHLSIRQYTRRFCMKLNYYFVPLCPNNPSAITLLTHVGHLKL